MISRQSYVMVDDENFERVVLRGKGFTLVSFWAEWSGSCHIMEPVVEDVVNMFNGELALIRCNVDDSRKIAERFGVLSPPALLLFKEGHLLDGIAGNIAKDELFQRLKSHAQKN